MGRVFVTGDKHGSFNFEDYPKIRMMCMNLNTTIDDVMIVLGDHGIHYDEGRHDAECKKMLGEYPITFVMIRGNHDMRPCSDWERCHIENDTMVGTFIVDPVAKNILYTEEYGWYWFNDIPVFVAGGAYSADKFYRLEMQKVGHRGFLWFEDEQLNDDERKAAEELLFNYDHGERPFVIMTHTCPQRFTPTEMFIPQVDQTSVDRTMEIWFDDIYDRIWKENKDLARWYCGHWHTDKTDDMVRFVFHDIIELGDA